MKRLLIYLFAALCALSPAVRGAGTDTSIPADLSIRAQFFPGAGGEWMIPEEVPKLPKPLDGHDISKRQGIADDYARHRPEAIVADADATRQERSSGLSRPDACCRSTKVQTPTS